MNKKYIDILYRLVVDKIEETSKQEYEWRSPTHKTERVYTINDGTRKGYYETMAIENMIGIEIPRSGTLVTRELSYEESKWVNKMNQMESDRLYNDRILYEDLINLKQILKDLLENNNK